MTVLGEPDIAASYKLTQNENNLQEKKKDFSNVNGYTEDQTCSVVSAKVNIFIQKTAEIHWSFSKINLTPKFNL